MKILFTALVMLLSRFSGLAWVSISFTPMPRHASCPCLGVGDVDDQRADQDVAHLGRGRAAASPPPHPQPYGAVAAAVAAAERRDVLLLVEGHVVDDEDVGFASALVRPLAAIAASIAATMRSSISGCPTGVPSLSA